jgi:hypothetical protein
MQGTPNVNIVPYELQSQDPLERARRAAVTSGGLFAAEGPEATLRPRGGVLPPPSGRELRSVLEDVLAAGTPAGPQIRPRVSGSRLAAGAAGRIGAQLSEEKAAARIAEAARIAGMPSEMDIFATEGPEALTSPASAIAAAIAPRPRTPATAAAAAPEKPPAQLTREPVPFSTEDAFKGAMDAFTEASGQEVQPDKTAEDYMKEFADITGIDISGKPDKSAALMAFGLALMQNRAGSGFNVGNILRSVGEAGEKALPELQEAKKEAKAARIAAGKYALEKIQAGESARAALAAEQRAFAREAFLKQMEFDAAAAKTAGQQEIKNVDSVPVVPDLNVRRGMYDGLGVFVDATDTANTLVRGYNANFNALQTLTELENSITEIANSESPALTMIADRVNSVLAGAGLKDPRVSFGDEGLSQEEKANALRDSFIQEFKRLLTQETGNGISNVDIERALASLGQLNIFQNPQQAIFRVRETRGLFDGKLGEISSYIDKAINDPSQFVNEREYNRAVEIFNERLGGASPYNVTVTEGVPIVDVTGG